MVEISSNLFLVSTLESTRFLRIQLRNAGLQPDCSLGSGKEERLEGGVGLRIKVLGVPQQSGTLGREQRAGHLLREELERDDDEEKNNMIWVTGLNLSKLSREDGRGLGAPADLQILR